MLEFQLKFNCFWNMTNGEGNSRGPFQYGILTNTQRSVRQNKIVCNCIVVDLVYPVQVVCVHLSFHEKETPRHKQKPRFKPIIELFANQVRIVAFSVVVENRVRP